MARPIAAIFGPAFREAYEEAGLTQVQIAEQMRARGWPKVDQRYVSRWALGQVVPALDQMIALDDILGEAKGYLLMRAGLVDPEALVERKARQAED